MKRMNIVTIVACDKDGNATYSESFFINASLPEHVKEFEKRVPFSRYFTEHEVNDEVELSDEEIAWLTEAGLED